MAQFMEQHARALYRLLNHGDEHTDCRCIDVNKPGSPPLSREVLKNEENFIKWCRAWNGRANCYVGRNPRKPDGSVSRITTYSLDIDPEHPPRTSVSPQVLAKTVLAGRAVLQAWPGGYLAESGNGVLVLYRLAVPLSDELEAFKRRLAGWQDAVRKHLSVQFPGEVRCDSIHDNERIIKITGTLSTKGDKSNWRVARFFDVPVPPYRSVSGDGLGAVPSDGQAGRGPRVVSRSFGNGGTNADLALAVRYRQEGLGAADTLALLRKNWTVPLDIDTLDRKVQLASSCLARINKARCENYDEWLKVGLALSELGEVGLQLWDAWSKKSEKYKAGACEEKWSTFSRTPSISVGSLKFWAEQDQAVLVSQVYSGSTGGAQPVVQPAGGQPELCLAQNMGDFLAELSAIDWLCKPIIARKAIGFVAGLPETMKTWALIDLAVECARESGGKWLGLFPVDGCRVLYVDQERFKGETQRRFKGVMGAKGLASDALKDRLFIRCGTTTRIDLEPSYQAFRHELARIKPDLVLVDSFATFHTREENNRRDIQEVMERVKALRQEFNCAVVFVDHENKGVFHAEKEGDEAPSAFRMAGSVAKPAAAEFVLTVRRFDRASSKMYHTKSTLSQTVPSFTVSVHDTPDGHILVSGVA